MAAANTSGFPENNNNTIIKYGLIASTFESFTKTRCTFAVLPPRMRFYITGKYVSITNQTLKIYARMRQNKKLKTE